MTTMDTQITVAGPTVTIRYDERGKPAETLVSDGDRRWSSRDQVGVLLPGWVMDALADALLRWSAAA
jgi:hypothetical protein